LANIDNDSDPVGRRGHRVPAWVLELSLTPGVMTAPVDEGADPPPAICVREET